VTLEDIEHFAEFTGDTFYAHMDEEAARANPLFGGRVAHGYLIVSWAAGLFVDPDPGPVLANYGVDNLRFLTPVKPGEELTVTLTAKQITPRGGADHGEVRWDAVVVTPRASPWRPTTSSRWSPRPGPRRRDRIAPSVRPCRQACARTCSVTSSATRPGASSGMKWGTPSSTSSR
jgi:acyl dehydratase